MEGDRLLMLFPQMDTCSCCILHANEPSIIHDFHVILQFFFVLVSLCLPFCVALLQAPPGQGFVAEHGRFILWISHHCLVIRSTLSGSTCCQEGLLQVVHTTVQPQQEGSSVTDFGQQGGVLFGPGNLTHQQQDTGGTPAWQREQYSVHPAQ